jgi:hypothetical protein
LIGTRGTSVISLGLKYRPWIGHDGRFAGPWAGPLAGKHIPDPATPINHIMLILSVCVRASWPGLLAGNHFLIRHHPTSTLWWYHPYIGGAPGVGQDA